jgi:hypothetical protein
VPEFCKNPDIFLQIIFQPKDVVEYIINVVVASQLTINLYVVALLTVTLQTVLNGVQKPAVIILILVWELGTILLAKSVNLILIGLAGFVQ